MARNPHEKRGYYTIYLSGIFLNIQTLGPVSRLPHWSILPPRYHAVFTFSPPPIPSPQPSCRAPPHPARGSKMTSFWGLEYSSMKLSFLVRLKAVASYFRHTLYILWYRVFWKKHKKIWKAQIYLKAYTKEEEKIVWVF